MVFKTKIVMYIAFSGFEKAMASRNHGDNGVTSALELTALTEQALW